MVRLILRYDKEIKLLSKQFLKKMASAKELRAFWFGYRMGIKMVRDGIWTAVDPAIQASRISERNAKGSFKNWISPFDKTQRETKRPAKKAVKKSVKRK